MTELAVGDLSGPERERLADHVVACRRCSEQYQILARTHAQALGQQSRTRALLPWITAAGIAIAAAAGVLIVRSVRPEDALRGVRGTPGAVVPGDGTRLGEPPAILRWPAQPGSEGFRVRLFTSAGDALWEANAGDLQQLAVPESVRSRLRAGQSYFWTVEVQMPLEKQRLGPFTFTLRP